MVGSGLTALALLLIWIVPGTISLGRGLPSVPNPTGISKLTALSGAGNGLWALGLLPLLLAVASLFARYRRSAGEERLQLKWFAYAATVTVGVVLPLAPVAASGSLGQLAFDVAVVAGVALALPSAIGIAILKYRLYAIDRIISRVISYAIITAVIAGVFAGLVILATDVLPVKTPVAVATATLAAAALFNPLRKRVQRTVDRRFNRSHYNAQAVVAAFTARLRQTVDLDTVQGELLDTVQHAFEPAHASVWLAARDSAQPLTSRLGEWPVTWVGVAGFESAASSSRSQRATWPTTALLCLTCLAPSVDVLWRPLVSVAAVTELATHRLRGSGGGHGH